MSNQDVSRPDLTGEFRFRVPLAIAIPLGAVLIIGLLAFGFSRVLLSVPKDAATAIAIVLAANVLGACAFIALRPRLQRASVMELALVAMYPVIVGIAIANLGVGTEEAASGAEAAEGTESAGPQEGGDVSEIVAKQISFNTESLTLKAGKPTEIPFDNQDTALHNLSIYPDEDAALAKEDPLFKGPDVQGGESADYKIDPLKKGEYTFICDYHANMIGDGVVQ